jgi:hypothetical protein
MIIKPVMIRSTLKARGVHVATGSFMKLSSKSRRTSIGIASRLCGKASLGEEIWRGFAKQQGIMLSDECLRATLSTEDEVQPSKKGREIFPAFRSRKREKII